MPPKVLEAAAALVELGVQIFKLNHGDCIITDAPGRL